MDRRRQRRTARRALAVAVAAILLAPHAGAADAPARVRLTLPACDGAFDKRELARLLQIELGTDGVKELAVGDASDALATIRVDATPCGPDVREVTVAIDDAATGKTVRRALAIGDVAGPARARALALAIAELLRASWSELSMPDAPPPPAVAPPEIVRAVRLRTAPPARPAEAPPPAVAPPARMGTLLRLTLDARAFPSYQSVVLGPGLGISFGLGELPLRVRADAQVGFGRAYDALGTIDLTLASGDLGLMLGGGPEGVRLEVGPVLAIGGGWATGHPIDGGTGASANALIVTAHGAATGAVRVGAGFWTVLELDAGATLQSLDAQAANRPASGFGGPMLGASIGIAREL